MQARFIASLLVTTGFWGTTFPFAKILLAKLTPIGYTVMIMIFGLGFLVGCLLVQRKVSKVKPTWQANRRLILVLGGIILPAALLIQYFATEGVPSTAIHLAIISNL